MNQPLSRTAVLCVLLVATTLFLDNARKTEVPVERPAFATFPMDIGPWRAVVDPPLDDEVLKVLGVDDYLSRAYYQPNGAAVGLYVGFYGSQRQGDTIHSPMNCLPGAGWEPVSEGRLQIASADGKGRDIIVNRYLIQKGLDRQLVLYWYQSQGRVVASEYWSRAYLIHDAIRNNRTDGALVRVIAPIRHEADGTEAEAMATAFVHALFPLLGGHLPS